MALDNVTSHFFTMLEPIASASFLSSLSIIHAFDNKDWFIIVDHWSDYFELSQLQWNSVSTVTNGPRKFGRNNEVTVLEGVSLQENVWSFLPGGHKKWP